MDEVEEEQVEVAVCDDAVGEFDLLVIKSAVSSISSTWSRW